MHTRPCPRHVRGQAFSSIVRLDLHNCAIRRVEGLGPLRQLQVRLRHTACLPCEGCGCGTPPTAYSCNVMACSFVLYLMLSCMIGTVHVPNVLLPRQAAEQAAEQAAGALEHSPHHMHVRTQHAHAVCLGGDCRCWCCATTS